MITEVYLPALGETMTEARIVSWLKQEGSPVAKGEPIFEIETDKATLEVESLSGGYLRKIIQAADKTVPVGETVALITDTPDEPLPAGGAAAPAPAQPAASEAPASPAAAPAAAASNKAGSKKLVASPRARRLADKVNLDVSLLAGLGTGPGGRIVEADVKRYLDGHKAAPAAAPAAPVASTPAPAPAPAPVAPAAQPVLGGSEIPLVGMRKAIAERMTASVHTSPHIYVTMSIDMTAAEAWRKKANAVREARKQRSVSATAVILKVCAWALERHPRVNASIKGDRIVEHEEINIGMAVALEDGLIVPVVHNVVAKGIGRIGEEIADLGERARSNRLKASEMSGGTFTVSNLGMFGVDQFTAIINQPEAAILAVGRIAKQFVPGENDEPMVKPMMTVTLSADHRIIDGAIAARFLADVRTGLEDPSLVLL
jgi:pyruvate dehydrogenase E2 component (dihydrolipoamide acetyltransferase)